MERHLGATTLAVAWLASCMATGRQPDDFPEYYPSQQRPRRQCLRKTTVVLNQQIPPSEGLHALWATPSSLPPGIRPTLRVAFSQRMLPAGCSCFPAATTHNDDTFCSSHFTNTKGFIQKTKQTVSISDAGQSEDINVDRFFLPETPYQFPLR